MSVKIFNHSNEQIHDEEIASQADAVLCRLLSFLLLKISSGFGAHANQATYASTEQPQVATVIISDEIACTCQIIEMVYRCSKEVLETSFRKIGSTFLNLFANILARLLPIYHTSNDSQDMLTADNTPLTDMKSATICLQSVTKTLCHYARVQSATTSIAQRPELLSLMISLLQHPIGGVMPFEAYHNTLWILANIACCEENMQSMASHPQLLDTVIQAANFMHETLLRHQVALRLQHSAFRCLLNLSWDNLNRVAMSERDDLLENIAKSVRMKALPSVPSVSTGDSVGASSSSSSSSSNHLLLQTRMFALGTLRNIANTTSPQQYRLCTTQDGMLLDLLCDITTHSSEGEDSSIRDKAFAVIFNLVSKDTAVLLISHPRLVDTLVEAASVHTTLQEAMNISVESASAMSFRALNALDGAVASSDCPEELRFKVRQAIDRVNEARRYNEMAVPELY